MKQILIIFLVVLVMGLANWLGQALAETTDKKVVTTTSTLPAQGVTPVVSFTTQLLAKEKKALEKSATVEVQVAGGLQITDPDLTDGKPVAGQGHIHYQIDGGPWIATTTPKLSFHGLTPGSHRVVVAVAGNDHKVLGPQQEILVTIP